MEEVRKGAMDIGGRLDSKQLQAIIRKSKYVIMGDTKSRTSCLDGAKTRPIMVVTEKGLI